MLKPGREKLGGTEQGRDCGGTGEQMGSQVLRKLNSQNALELCGSSEIVVLFPLKRSRFLSGATELRQASHRKGACSGVIPSIV